MRTRTWLGALCCLVLVSGCTAGEESGGPGTEACEGPLGKPLSLSNINAMTACCQADQGNAHCLEASRVPSEIQPFVASCDGGGYCIPDSFLSTGAAEPPKQCTAFGGAGVCLSICIPQVSENAGLLRPDTCTGADELCVPCINPLDQTETGACQLLELATCVGEAPPPNNPVNSCDDPNTCNYEASCPPVFDPAALPACGPDAHCLDAALVPPDQAARLATCPGSTALCVPDVFIKTGGKFTAPTCVSVNGAEGRCLSEVLPDVKAQAGLLPQSSCSTGERCTPCFNPLDGTSTGACNQSCDTGPVEAPKPFASCCGTRAKCVPTAALPPGQSTDNLDAEACEDVQAGSVCVPNEIIANGPFPSCAATPIIGGAYTGVCLSDCLDLPLEGLIPRGNCNSGYKCIPCTGGNAQPGTPGCPAGTPGA